MYINICIKTIGFIILAFQNRINIVSKNRRPEFMKNGKLILLFWFTLSVITMGSCKKQKSIENADLLYEFANLQSTQVNTGEPLILESAIINQPADCDNCRTLQTIPCQRSIRLEYRADLDSPWRDAELKDETGNQVLAIVKPVPEIQPGTLATASEGFVFTTPGIYRYQLASDINDIIPERNEDNNDAATDEGDVKAYSDRRIFRLLVTVIDQSGNHLPAVKGKKPVAVKYIP